MEFGQKLGWRVTMLNKTPLLLNVHPSKVLEELRFNMEYYKQLKPEQTPTNRT